MGGSINDGVVGLATVEAPVCPQIALMDELRDITEEEAKLIRRLLASSLA